MSDPADAQNCAAEPARSLSTDESVSQWRSSRPTAATIRRCSARGARGSGKSASFEPLMLDWLIPSDFTAQHQDRASGEFSTMLRYSGSSPSEQRTWIR